MKRGTTWNRRIASPEARTADEGEYKIEGWGLDRRTGGPIGKPHNQNRGSPVGYRWQRKIQAAERRCDSANRQ
ncbi:hypothetical protein HAX54_011760 [Datura stramonium]|uniref:Uncharacterized protein n=1 Tax=Datura stramonium TaxID=4076 RepID=A0ABS8TIL6_DATST|nr:hypothetical protein [Datura stramonium]